MEIIHRIREKAKAEPKTIALPEAEDKRVKEAASIIEKEGIAKILLLDRRALDKGKQEEYAQKYYALRKAKGISLDEAIKTLAEPLYYAAMMTHCGDIDGFVAGASHTTPDVVRAAIQCLGVDERKGYASSFFIMVVPNCPYGEGGTFVFADCGIIPDPNPRQLTCIVLSAAEFAIKVLDFIPRIALLNYSTKGSAKGKSIEKVTEALGLIRETAPNLLVDGEMQLDAAVVPEVAKIKCPGSPVGGKANILIFPNLEAGNIGYKLVQRLAKARALGPLFLGLNKPASDLSRGCSVDDIVDCVAVTAIRAQ